ncbi:hypothetical protein LPJ75_003755 [Coemansia sp. RSA 2598]|nr:hypothetical protein LPJ75_003755 [Coemansia sp. RSA 2598]
MNSYIDQEWSSIGLSFDPWAYSRAEKQGILLSIFKTSNVLTVLELSPSDMLEFCLDIELLYKNVPYHSFNHALDVVVKLYYVLYDLQAAAYLASYDIAALLIAGLCHDAGHPGLNNLFQKNAGTDLAKRYPDAILERYSMDLAEEYILKHNLLRNVENLRDPMYGDSTTTQIDVASRMIYSIRTAILHTDMSRHFDVVERCKVLVSLLSKKARRISEHEAYQRDCGIDPLSHHQEQFSPASGTCSPAEKSLASVHMRFAKQITRARSPSEPPAPTKSLFAYSLLNPVSTVSSSGGKANESEPAGIAQSYLSLPGSGVDECGKAGGAKGTKGRRLQVRRSVSMRDALLDSSQRQGLIDILLHAVDVFNPILPWSMCKKWSDLMNVESFHQGDLEKKLKLPVSPNMDRECTDQRQVSLDFGNIIIRPFFSELVSIFPVDDILLPSLEINMQKWSRLSSDASFEISVPEGANNNMYSWPIEPVQTPASRSSSGPLFEGRRLSIAAGTVDIPSSRLEMIRRHSHEGFEALHRRMVGRLFSKHLEKIQERRKISYTAAHHPQGMFERMRSSPNNQKDGEGTDQIEDSTEHNTPMLSPSILRQWKGFDTSMLSPVTEASCLEDSSLPSSAVAAEFGPESLQSHDMSGETQTSYEDARHYPPPQISVASARTSDHYPMVPESGATVCNYPGCTNGVISSNPYMHTGEPYLNNYHVDKIRDSFRLYRSTSLDPSILAHMPTSYPSLGSTSGATNAATGARNGPAELAEGN